MRLDPLDTTLRHHSVILIVNIPVNVECFQQSYIDRSLNLFKKFDGKSTSLLKNSYAFFERSENLREIVTSIKLDEEERVIGSINSEQVANFPRKVVSDRPTNPRHRVVLQRECSICMCFTTTVKPDSPSRTSVSTPHN